MSRYWGMPVLSMSEDAMEDVILITFKMVLNLHRESLPYTVDIELKGYFRKPHGLHIIPVNRNCINTVEAQYLQ